MTIALIRATISVSLTTWSYSKNNFEGFAQDCSNSILAILQEKKKMITGILNIHGCSSLIFELYITF